MVAECTHRFCKSCIETSLRTHKNECPLCRLHIPSRRSLRLDPNFDKVIACLYPDIEGFESKEYKTLEMAQRQTSEAFRTATSRGIARQAQIARAQPPLAPAAQSSSTTTTTTTANGAAAARQAAMPKPTAAAAAAAAAGAALKPKSEKRPGRPPGSKNKRQETGRDEDCFFVLRRHPKDLRGTEKALTREYIRTSAKIRVQHLKQFLKAQYAHLNSVFPEAAFTLVFVGPNGAENPLNNNVTLQEIVDEFKHGDRDADLVLHYKLHPTA
jgi:hypothetical protein